MESNKAFSGWVQRIGVAKAAELLDISESMVSHIATGRRRLTAERAGTVVRVTNGSLSLRDLRPDLFDSDVA